MNQLELSTIPLGDSNRPLPPHFTSETLLQFTLNNDRSDISSSHSKTSVAAAIPSNAPLHVPSNHSILPNPTVAKSSSPPYLTLNISRSPLLSLLNHSPLLPSEYFLRSPLAPSSSRPPLVDTQITASLVKPLAPLSFASDHQRRQLSASANKQKNGNNNKHSDTAHDLKRKENIPTVSTAAVTTMNITTIADSPVRSFSIHGDVHTCRESNQQQPCLPLPPPPPSTISPKEAISFLNFLEAMDKDVSYEFQRVSDTIKEAHAVADEYRQEKECRRLRWVEKNARERERRERDERETKGIDSEFWLS
jgi:hypothetical protein